MTTETQNYYESILAAADFIAARADTHADLALVLGSGWDQLLEQIEGIEIIPYASVPGLRPTGVAGHAGEFAFGTVAGRRVMVMCGRYHLYEGMPLKQATLPIRILRQMGAQTLILTNAAGAVNTSFAPGDMMMLTDHINMTCDNPLIGENDERLGERFTDMSHVYDPQLMNAARRVAAEQGLALREGVYAHWTGPCYETPAEIRMLRAMGADAVGMSTVPEATVARHAGMRTLAFSCLTNMAAGVLPQPLSHKEVLETAARVREPFGRFMVELARALATDVTNAL